MKTKKDMLPRTKSLEKKSASEHNVLMVCPTTAVYDTQTSCLAVLDNPLPTSTDFFIKFLSPCKSAFVHAEKVNETTLFFQTPGNFPVGEAKITIHHGNGQAKLCGYSKSFIFKPKLELLTELLEAVSEPMALIASAYNMTNQDTVAVDFKLEHALRTNMPVGFHLLKTETQDASSSKAALSSLKNPSLLHFAARHNLVRLSITLLNCPGALEALETTNKDSLTPCQLAKRVGNNDLAEILAIKKNEDHQPSVDEVYEQMSSDVYEQYVKVKKDFEIYEEMNGDELENEEYEDMFGNRRQSSNSRASIPIDRQSVYSSDSGVSCTSVDSRGSSVVSESGAPAIPPASYKRTNKPKPSLLISELKRKTEEKRNSQGDSQEINNVPPASLNIRRPVPVPPRTTRSPRSKVPLNDAFNRVGNSTDPVPDGVYDVPPARNASPFVADDEVYDTPPTRNNNATYQQTNNDFHAVPPVQDELYDTPPPRSIRSVKVSEIYDVPPSEDMYDVPPTEDMYDVPPTEELYDVPPSNDSAIEEDVYDDVSPLKSVSIHSSHQDIFKASDRTSHPNVTARNLTDVTRIGKRYSEPVLSLSKVEQQRLNRLGDCTKPALPPPNLPPRNSTVPQLNPSFSQSKITGRPMPHIPPPHRR